MHYNRRRYKRRRSRLFRRGRDRTGGTWGRFKAPPSQEKKWHDTVREINVTNALQLLGTTAAPTVVSINLIPQGDTAITRDGRKCQLVSYYCCGTLKTTVAAQAVYHGYYKLWLVQDTQCNGANCLAADVFTIDTGGTPSLVHRNLENVERFRIIDCCRFQVNPPATNGGSELNGTTTYFECQGKLSVPLEFGGATGAITEIRSNNLFWIGLADTLTQGSSVAAIKLFTRLRFIG